MMMFGLVGSLISGVAAMSQGAYQAAIANANAKQNEYNAEASSHAAEMDTVDIGNQTAGERGQLVTSQGASGFALASPSFLSGIRAYTQNQYEGAVRRQFAGNQQAAAYRTEASINRAQAGAASMAGGFGMLSSIVSGFGSLIGSSSASMMSPGYLGVPQIRSMYG